MILNFHTTYIFDNCLLSKVHLLSQTITSKQVVFIHQRGSDVLDENLCRRVVVSKEHTINILFICLILYLWELNFWHQDRNNIFIEHFFLLKHFCHHPNFSNATNKCKATWKLIPIINMNVEGGMLVCLLSNHGNLSEPIFIKFGTKAGTTYRTPI